MKATTYTEQWQKQRTTYIIFPALTQMTPDFVDLLTGAYTGGEYSATMNKFEIEDHVNIGTYTKNKSYLIPKYSLINKCYIIQL